MVDRGLEYHLKIYVIINKSYKTKRPLKTQKPKTSYRLSLNKRGRGGIML